MAYVEIPDSDIGVGDYGRTDTVFTRLRDNIRALRHSLYAVLFAETTTTSTTFVQAKRFEIFVPDRPDETGYSRELRLRIEGRVSAGTGEWRLKDVASGNAGTAASSTSTTYGERSMTLAVQSSWKGTLRQIDVEFRQVTSGTVYARSDARIAGELDF
jgi:hypothetical protein